MSKADKNVCCKCNSGHEDQFYKYNNEIYCFDCLIEELKNNKELYTVTTTNYYNADWRRIRN